MLRLCLCILSVLVASVCAHGQTKLVVGYGAATAWAPALVAKDHGIFEKHGLAVTLQFVPNTATQPALLISNSIDVGSITPTTLIFAVEGGVELTAVASATENNKANPFGAVLAANGVDIKSAADFRGKSVGVPGLNAVLHISFMRWLQLQNVDPRDVQFIEIIFNQTTDLLRSRKVDAAVTVEPFISRSVAANAAHIVSRFPHDLASPSYKDAFWVMRKDYVRTHPNEVAAFKAAMKEATEFTTAYPEEARKTAVTYLKLPEAIAASVQLPTFTTTLTPDDMQFWLDMHRVLGLSKSTLTGKDLVSP
jgi:NitT/TauT family transport system substrate-binding protein